MAISRYVKSVFDRSWIKLFGAAARESPLLVGSSDEIEPLLPIFYAQTPSQLKVVCRNHWVQT